MAGLNTDEEEHRFDKNTGINQAVWLPANGMRGSSPTKQTAGKLRYGKLV
jgi:hypothetical protein